MILSIVNQIVLLVGVPVIAGCLIYIGRKLQILDDLNGTVEKIKYYVKGIADFLTKKEPDFIM